MVGVALIAASSNSAAVVGRTAVHRAAAVSATQQAREDVLVAVAVGALPLILCQLGLRPLESPLVDDRFMVAFADHRVWLLCAIGLPPFDDLAILNRVILAHPILEAYERPSVLAIGENIPDGRDTPLVAPCGEDTFRVENLGYGADTCVRLEILPEDHADNLRPLLVNKNLFALMPVADRSAAAGSAPAVLRSVEESTGHVAGQVTQVGVFALLLDQVNQPAREVVPVDLALGDGFEPHPRVTEGENPMATLDRIEPPETILVPTEHNGELALLGIFPHAKEPNAAFGIVAADCFVEVLPEHVVSVLLGIPA